MNELSFYLVTDTHWFEPSLGASGSKYDEYMKTEQMCLAENSAIARATFDTIAADKGIETVIIPGDLSKDGEKASHLSFIEELKKLQAAGKKVYVITARHDYNDNPRGYAGDEYVPVEGTRRSELRGMYNAFGYSDALAVDDESLSYVAQLQPGLRMLAINCDGDEQEKGYFSRPMLGWIKQQLDAAKRDGCEIFAINHYPLLPTSPFFEFIGDAQVKGWRESAAFLADNGVKIIFTGHMHIQSVKEFTSPAGNRIVDVCTAALVGSPAKYRRVTFKGDGSVEVKSLDVPAFEWDMQGLTNKEYFDRQFRQMIPNKINKVLGGGGVKSVAKKAINTITVGGIGRLLWFRPAKELRKRKFIDVACDVAMSIFSGDPPYKKGTPVYEAFDKALSRLGFVLKKVEPKLTRDGIKPDLKQMALDTIGREKEMSDNDTTIKL